MFIIKDLNFILKLKTLIFNGDLNVEFLSIHSNFKILFKKYLAYCIINNDIVTSEDLGDEDNFYTYYNPKYDLFYTFMIHNDVIYNELVDYCHEMYGYKVAYFNNFLDNRYNEDGLNYFMKFINLVKNNFFTSDILYKYRNLLTFLEVFSVLSKEINSKNSSSSLEVTGLTNLSSNYSDINISTLMQVLNKNEQIRSELERYITECEEREIYLELKKLLNIKFKSDFNFDIYHEFESFKEYLLNNDEELYNFVTEFGTFNTDNERREEIEERILELSTAIETYIASNGNIVYNSTFNVIFSNMKEFASLLIEVFKAYTLDTLYSNNVLDFDDPVGEQIKIFDEMDDIDFEHFQLDAEPEYLDIQDDIRKDNGDIDSSYNLFIRNLILNTFESDEELSLKDEYLQYIKAYVNIYEGSENLPYAVTNLSPSEFKIKYGDVILSSPLGLSNETYKYNYIEDSYWYLQNSYTGECDINSIKSFNYYDKNQNKTISYNICINKENDLDESNDRDSRGYIVYKNSTYYIYKPSSNNTYKIEEIGENDNIAYISNISNVDISDGNVTRSKYKFTLNIYNHETNKFEPAEKSGFLSVSFFNNNFINYLVEHDMSEGDFNVYYDPYLECGYYSNVYYYNPLTNINSEDNDLMFLSLNTDYYLNNYNDTSRKTDNRRETLFYMRDNRGYNFTETGRIYYNEKIHKEIVTVPDIDYINYLNENDMVNGDYIYKLKDSADYTYYSTTEIDNTNKYKINDNAESLTNIYTTSIKGNEVKSIELELGKKYYLNVHYSYSDLIKMYEDMNYSDIFKEKTIYIKMNGTGVDSFIDKINIDTALKFDFDLISIIDIEDSEKKNIIENIDTTDTEYKTYAVTFKTKKGVKKSMTDLLDENSLSELLNFIDKVGSSRDSDLGYNKDNPFMFSNISNQTEGIKVIYDPLDEMLKYKIYFVVDNSTGSTTIYKYDHECSTTDKLYKIGYGYTLNKSDKFSINILYEALRYYNYEDFHNQIEYTDEIINGKTSVLPLAVSINSGEELLPEPILTEEDGILKVFHTDYTEEQLKKFSIMNDSAFNYYTGNIFDFFYTIKNYSANNYTDNNNKNHYYIDYINSNKSETNFDIIITKDLLTSDLMMNAGTSFNALDDNFKLSIPSTINNNAYLVTLYQNIEKPDTSTNITIEITDTTDSDDESSITQNFAYIAVENKGITDYNTESYTYKTRPLLYEISKFASSLGLKNISTNKKISKSAKDAAAAINEMSKVGRFTVESYLNNISDKNILTLEGQHDESNIVYDENYNYVRLKTFNKFNDYSDFGSDILGGNEKDKEFFYDYDYAKEIGATEKIIDSGICDGPLSNDLVETHIIIKNLDENEIIYDSYSSKDNNCFNESLKLNNDSETIKRNSTYKVYVETLIQNTGANNGNFLFNLDIDDDKTVGCDVSNKKVTYDSDIYGNSIAILNFDFTPTKKECNLKFKMSGIIIFETILDYDFTDENSDTHKLLLISPSKNRNLQSDATKNQKDVHTHCGSIVYYGDGSGLQSMPFTYTTHEFDTSDDDKKQRRVMISTGLPMSAHNNRATNEYSNYNPITNYCFAIDNYWLTTDNYTITMPFLLYKEEIENTTTNKIIIGYDENDNAIYNGDDGKGEDVATFNTKINYDINGTKYWSKTNNNYILKYGNNKLETSYSYLFNDDGIFKDINNRAPSVTVTNTSNKYITNARIPSTIVYFGEGVFKNNKNFDSFTFGPLATYYGESLFENSLLKEVYFLNNALTCSNYRRTIDKKTPPVYSDSSFNINYIPYNSNDNIYGFATFGSKSFKNISTFKDNHFSIKLPYNLGFIESEAFYLSTLNQIIFDNCNYIYTTSINAFSENEYLNRRYIVDFKGNDYRDEDDNLVYEGQAKMDDSKYSYDSEGNFQEYNTTVFDEKLQPTNGYKFSDQLSIKFKHGDNVFINRFHSNVFIDDIYAKTIDTGNAYAIGYSCFSGCSRLMNLLLPEVIYFGNFFVENVQSSMDVDPRVKSFIINYNNKKYLAYYYKDSDIESGYRVNIDGKAYEIMTSCFNGTYIGNHAIYVNCKTGWLYYNHDDKNFHGKMVDIYEENKDEVDGEDYYIDPKYIYYERDGYTDYDEYIDYIESVIEEKPEIYNNGEDSTLLVTKFKDYYLEYVNSGYNAEKVMVTTASNVSKVCENCISLVNVEFGNKLYIISDNNFINCGKLRINNNHLYSIDSDYTEDNIIDLGELIKDDSDFSIEDNNVKYIEKFYDVNKPYVNWNSLIAVEINDIIYNDAFNIIYHGTNDEFKEVRKKINWNARGNKQKYKNISTVSNKRIESPYSKVGDLPYLHEKDDNFTGNNYFTLTMNDSELYFDSLETYKKNDNTYEKDNNYTFTIYSLKDFNPDNNFTYDGDPLNSLYLRAKNTYNNIDSVLATIHENKIAGSTYSDERKRSNEYWYIDPLKVEKYLPSSTENVPKFSTNEYHRTKTESLDAFPDRYYTDDDDIKKEIFKNYIKDLNIIKFNQNKFSDNESEYANKNLYLFKATVKSKMRNINIDNIDYEIPSRNFIDGYQYFNLDFDNDDYTGYYVSNYERSGKKIALFNETIQELISDVVDNSINNPIFKDNISYMYRYGYNGASRILLDTTLEDLANSKYKSNYKNFCHFYEGRKFEKNPDDPDDVCGTLSLNESDFNELVNKDNTSKPLTPSVLNYATSYQLDGFGCIAYGMLGMENPRGRFNAENYNGITLYDISANYPIKDFTDSEDNYLLKDTNTIFLKDCDITNKDSNYYINIRNVYDYNEKYTNTNQFRTIPNATTNIIISKENDDKLKTSSLNRFSFIYRLFGVIYDSTANKIVGYRVNGWMKENEKKGYRSFSDTVTILAEDYYDTLNVEDKEFTFNNTIYNLHDIYNDLLKNTVISNNLVRISFAGGIREIDLSSTTKENISTNIDFIK
jgi:hypothetical protein